jgi:hypothetical protein
MCEQTYRGAFHAPIPIRKERTTIMEYIYVTVPEREDNVIDVLINGEKNGKTEETILLGSAGFVIVSVDLREAEEQTVMVENTTPAHPIVIEVNV